MDNEKFQEHMVDQFAKMFKEFQGLRGEFQGFKGRLEKLEASQVRMEDKFDKQISALHDFRISQEQTNKDIINRLDRVETKVEALQLETAHVRKVK